VFLKSDNKACSVTLRAKSEEEACKRAIERARVMYGGNFRVWRVFDEK